MSAGAAPAAAPDHIRVMVVDDSVMVRGIVSQWISSDSQFEIVATHVNGKRAIDDLDRAQPDVVILDLEMPEMDGLTALPIILKQRPSTMVVVASTLTRRGAEISLKALTLGAADYLPKPDAARGLAATDEFKRELLTKVKNLGLKALRRGGRTPSDTGPASPSPAAPTRDTAAPRTVDPKRMRPYSMSPVNILAVGSSTGGPQALTRLFADIGPSLANIPVVITQHMPATFTAILAEHVGRASGRVAAEGIDGEVIAPGRIYVAPGGKHMLLDRDGPSTIIRLSDDPPVNFCKPAVDPMFASVAKLFRRNALALVLTGMGSDGAKGAGLILDTGGSVIVQDEETSVVWGMPGATVAAGNTCEVLPLGGIARKVTRMLAGGRG